MLIYAQRPDATACASFETWNEKMSCRVNRGAKGIALPDLESRRPRLKYVFDMADVHAVRGIGRLPYLWKLREEHKRPILDYLKKLYGGTDLETTFEDRMVETAERIAVERYEDFLRDFDYAREGSALEELDELNAKICLRETLSSCIAYTLLSRCGADMSVWKEEFHFDYIHEFNTLKVLTVLGNATTEICRDILMDIGRTIREWDRQAERERQWNAALKMMDNEVLKKTEKGLVISTDIHYNALKRESEGENKETIQSANKKSSRNL
ncbi:MAG: helicase SNF2, partial [Acetatifactor sp.]|nr:helicase SNF2 [Acetatifactor sp.]